MFTYLGQESLFESVLRKEDLYLRLFINDVPVTKASTIETFQELSGYTPHKFSFSDFVFSRESFSEIKADHSFNFDGSLSGTIFGWYMTRGSMVFCAERITPVTFTGGVSRLDIKIDWRLI